MPPSTSSPVTAPQASSSKPLGTRREFLKSSAVAVSGVAALSSLDVARSAYAAGGDALRVGMVVRFAQAVSIDPKNRRALEKLREANLLLQTQSKPTVR